MKTPKIFNWAMNALVVICLVIGFVIGGHGCHVTSECPQGKVCAFIGNSETGYCIPGPQNETHLPEWRYQSKSLLGEYSTAAVSADNEICSDIGRDILLKGGNAVDAAIATIFCIGVMDTHSAGPGGGHIMTIYNATTKKCHVVDAREKAPLAATENMYVNRTNEQTIGWRAIAVPGEVHGLWTEYKTFGGNVSWADLVNPTIELIEAGYPTSHALAAALNKSEHEIKEKTMRHHFINPETQKLYKVGEQIKTRKNYVKFLKTLSESVNPIQDFYKGKLTEQMVKEFEKNGGLLTLEDFAQYESIVRQDSDIIYTKLSHDRIVCGPPPPSGSAVSQAILNILDRIPFNMSTFEGNVDFFHKFVEASKFAYAQRFSLGDIDFVGNASEIAKNITSPKWAAEVRSKITSHTQSEEYYGGDYHAPPEDHGTTHINVIDRYGNAVSVTSTINTYFGAKVMSETTGILWNDQMDDFSTPGVNNYFGYPPSPANYIRPGKRPMSSMSPLVIFNAKNNKEVLAIGAAGGSQIISAVAGAAFQTLWLNRDVKQAIDLPRLHNQLKPNKVQLYEHNWPKEYIKALLERGHELIVPNSTAVVTAVHRVLNGTIFANSDYRKGSESEPSGY